MRQMRRQNRSEFAILGATRIVRRFYHVAKELALREVQGVMGKVHDAENGEAGGEGFQEAGCSEVNEEL